MPYLPIDTGYYVSSAKPIADQVLMNWYLDYPETQTMTPAQWLPTPGLKQLFNTGDDQINRGAIVVNGVPYFVNGQKLYKMERTFTPLGAEIINMVLIDAIAGESMVSIATNGDQIVIVVPAAQSYVYTIATNALTQITSPAFLSLGPSVKVSYIDGYFVHVSVDGKTAFNSALNDGLSYNALDFAEAESDPDGLVSNHTFNGKLFLVGQTTTEVYVNSGALNFPFQRSYVISVGCVARNSFANFGTTFAFIGQDIGGQPAVYAFDGNQFQRISNGSIDSILQRTSPEDLAAAFAFSYSQDGAIFYGFSTKNNTFVYDARASQNKGSSVWHARESYGLDRKKRWRVNSVINAYGRYLVGDSERGIIGDMRIDTFDEYGVKIRRTGIAGPFKDASGPLFWRKLEIMIDAGQGDLVTSNPVIRMSYSDDGGRNWSYEIAREIGSAGEYSRQATWYQLGRSLNSRMFKFECSEPVRCVVIGLIGDVYGNT